MFNLRNSIYSLSSYGISDCKSAFRLLVFTNSTHKNEFKCLYLEKIDSSLFFGQFFLERKYLDIDQKSDFSWKISGSNLWPKCYIINKKTSKWRCGRLGCLNFHCCWCYLMSLWGNFVGRPHFLCGEKRQGCNNPIKIMQPGQVVQSEPC